MPKYTVGGEEVCKNRLDLETDSYIVDSTTGEVSVRTTVEGITVDAPGLEVNLSHSDVQVDSVRVGDGVETIEVNTDGSINAGPRVADDTHTFTFTGETHTIPCDGFASFTLQLTGTWTGTMLVQGSIDGTTFLAIPFYDFGSRSTQLTTASNGIMGGNLAAFKFLRLIISPLSSGTVVANIRCDTNPGIVLAISERPAGFRAEARLYDGNGVAIPQGQTTEALSLPVVLPESQEETANIDYIDGILTVGTSEVEIKVGGSPLADRKYVTVYNDSSSVLYVGPTGVTTSGSTRGRPLEKKQSRSMPLGPNNSVFIIAGSASNDVHVEEYS